MSSVLVPYKDINRGHFYSAAIAYSDGRPLEFYQKCNKCAECDKSTGNCGQAVIKDNGFEPVYNPATGKYEAQEVSVIVPHKVRFCVVLSKNIYNHDLDYHHVYVAPVSSIYDTEVNIEPFKTVIQKNNIPHLHYIGKLTGRHAYLNLGDIKRIHKSLLLQAKNFPELSNDCLSDVCKKIATLLEIKEIKECETCKHNCDKCELKKNTITVNI